MKPVSMILWESDSTRNWNIILYNFSNKFQDQVWNGTFIPVEEHITDSLWKEIYHDIKRTQD